MPHTTTFVETDDEIISCLPIIQQIRPEIKTAKGLIEKVKKQKDTENFFFLRLTGENDEVYAVAGIRVRETLFWGKTLYVDDLVTNEKQRSHGYGKKILTFIEDFAKKNECQHLQLDSGVHRPKAHKFYFREGFHIRGFFFSKEL